MNKILFIFLFLPVFSQAQNITTVAGNGTAGYIGDNGFAKFAELSQPELTVIDTAGNMYVADYFNHVVRKIDKSGLITTFAGTGLPGNTGDGGAATTATFNTPAILAIDKYGDIYISDNSSYCIRKVNTAGIISTVAGKGVSGFSGDGGPATDAKLYDPLGLAVDASGTIYFADAHNNRIRKVDPSGFISTIAGSTPGYSGDGSPATAALINNPWFLTQDISGNIYFSEVGNNSIRKINTTGIIFTVAGNRVAGFGADGFPATATELDGPTGIAFDGAGNLYFAELNNQRIRQVNVSGIISTIAGNGSTGYSGDGGVATSAEINRPMGLEIDKSGTIFFTDAGNDVVRMINSYSPYFIDGHL